MDEKKSMQDFNELSTHIQTKFCFFFDFQPDSFSDIVKCLFFKYMYATILLTN